MDQHHHHHHVDAQQQPPNNGVAAGARPESHSTRFNNARALFEKLGVENRAPRPAALSLKIIHSNSKEDILSAETNGTTGQKAANNGSVAVAAPAANPAVAVGNNNNAGSTNGSGIVTAAKRDPKLIGNAFRSASSGGGGGGKSEKPEKPEKPERKFNSKELIEKQKNWTSHFTKVRSAPSSAGGRFNSEPNRCDIIRAVPGTVAYPAQQQPQHTMQQQATSPPQHQQRRSMQQQQPPEVKPRQNAQRSSLPATATVGFGADPGAPELPYKSPPLPHLPHKAGQQQQPQPGSPIRNASSALAGCIVVPKPSKTGEQPTERLKRGSIDSTTTTNNTTSNITTEDSSSTSSSICEATSITSITNSITQAAPTAATSTEYAQVRKHSVDAPRKVPPVPPQRVSSQSDLLQSEPNSPMITADEKQENEPTEKAAAALAAAKAAAPVVPNESECGHFWWVDIVYVYKL